MTAETDPDPVPFERDVAARLRAYLAGGRAAEQERELCAYVEFFLGALLAAEPGWPRYGWLDGLIPMRYVERGDGALEFLGAVYADEGRGEMMVEPVRMVLRLDERGAGLAAYEVDFGHADPALAVGPGRSYYRVRFPAAPAGWRYRLGRPPRPDPAGPPWYVPV